MYFSILLGEHSRKLLCSLTAVRSMGGGPRTFPGGLNKWQWKRMHEKKAREKESKLLEQEKQLYQARIRTQIRAKLAGGPEPISKSSDPSEPSYGPMTAKDHVKALADRFMKEGAEDLWNEADGPVESPAAAMTRPPMPNHRAVGTRPVDLRSLIPGEGGRTGDSTKSDGFGKPRNYSTLAPRRTKSRFSFRKSDVTSSSDDESELEAGNARRPRFGDMEMEGKENVKKSIGSSAALGKYDSIKRRRVPLKFLQDEVNISLSEEVDLIRNELKKRNLTENVEQRSNEDSIISQKRFDECEISPLTVKALTGAGYVQMTRVQEAAISAYLEGKDALVKAKTGTGKSAAFLRTCKPVSCRSKCDAKVP